MAEQGACWFEAGCWGQMEVHHKLSRQRGGTHVPENLVVLCEKHHDNIHHDRDYRRLAVELGLLLRNPANVVAS